ncbi:MAG: MATE family efflux transporter [Clostridia bacterium]|nr:MATE family efflux transporter [Clostridia bacterium]
MVDNQIKQGKIPKSSAVYKDYWNVALPAALEGVFLNIMLLADLAMVGRLGIAQVAAVGVCSQPRMIFQMLGGAIAVAVTAVVARRKGEGDIDGMNSCIKQALLFVTMIYTVLLGVSLLFANEIAWVCGANEEYINYAVIYLRYILVSSFFRVLFAPLMSAQIGVGNTKLVMYSNLTGNIINVVLNYVLIFGKFGFPRMEMAGAGLATVIGNVVIFLLLLKSVIRGKNGINILKGSWKFKKGVMKPLLNIGSSSLMEHSWERLGLFIFARLIAELGTVAMGIHHFCILIWDLYYYFGMGMGTASASFSGRKIGEGRKDLAIIYTKVAQRSGLIISMIASVIFIWVREPVFDFFVSDSEGIRLGVAVMGIVAMLIIPQTYAQVSSGTLRGAGDNRFIAVYSLAVSAILRPLSAYVFAFSLGLGLPGMWLALLLDESLKMVLTRYRIKKVIWLKIEF